MDAITYYGDISPRTAAYTAYPLLERALANMVVERFGQQKPLPSKSTRQQKFRRYLSLARVTAALAEGVTPDAEALTYEDVLSTIEQWGKLVKITDVIEDTHEDPILTEARDLVAEIMAESLEVIRIGVIKAGTSVYRAGNVATRLEVASAFDRGLLRKVVRLLRANKAKYFTQIVKASPNIATEPVGPAFWGMGHTDLESDIRSLSGFVPTEKYSESERAIPMEVGKCESVRFVLSPLFEPWLAGGEVLGATGMISVGTVRVDVYPLIIVAPDAYGIVPMKGKNAVEVKVINPGKPDKSDPLGQRGYVGAKTWHTAVILQDDFMVRIETGATNNPT